MKSWKTTLTGVGTVLASVAAICKGVAIGDYAVIAASIGGITSGIGLIFARDNGVTSEQAGAK